MRVKVQKYNGVNSGVKFPIILTLIGICLNPLYAAFIFFWKQASHPQAFACASRKALFLLQGYTEPRVIALSPKKSAIKTCKKSKKPLSFTLSCLFLESMGFLTNRKV
jgi:hypothetical protein